MTFNECFELLGLNYGATREETKRAYKRTIAKWHPDRCDRSDAVEITQKINSAYEILTEAFEDGNSFSNSKNSQFATEEQRSKKPRRQYNGKQYTVGFPDPNALEVFVKSSNILSIGYSFALSILYVKYHSNDVYAYYDVPQTVYESFLEAESPGKFRYYYVNKYRYEKLDEPNVPYVGNVISFDGEAYRLRRKRFLIG